MTKKPRYYILWTNLYAGQIRQEVFATDDIRQAEERYCEYRCGAVLMDRKTGKAARL